MLTGSPRAPGYWPDCRERLRNGASRELSARWASVTSILDHVTELAVGSVHTGAINPPILSCPLGCYHRLVAYRIVSRPSTSARLLFCLSPRLHAGLGPLGDNAAWRLGGGAGGGGRGSAYIRLHVTSIEIRNAAHLHQPRICCSVSLALAQPRLISIQRPRAPHLATAPCSSVLWLLWPPVRPAAAESPILHLQLTI